MRCSICDWSKDSPSEYLEGLHIPKYSYNVLRKDRKTGNWLCTACLDDVDDTYRDMIYRSKEELEFGGNVDSIFSQTDMDKD